MTTFTILNSSGDVQGRGYSAAEAAQAVMGYDGHEFEIRPAADGAGFDLWTSQFSRNSTCGGRPLVKSVIYSVNSDRAAAEAEIYQKVIDHAAWWKGCAVKSDEAYDVMVAQIAADEARIAADAGE